MLYGIDCTARINAQDPNYPTYKKVECTFGTNANDDNFYGRLVRCTFTITTLIVTAAKNWNQGINVEVTIDGENVSSALSGAIILSHDKNRVSTFSLNLKDTAYRPISDSHIDLDKIVVITAYINSQTKKVFTGLIDKIDVENTPFNISISGFGYGKELLDKRATIVSVENLANTAYGSKDRDNLIRYLAAQASITDVNIPKMAEVTIDNSFSDQSIWEMIQKEAMVELYWVRFDEDATMILGLDNIKTDTTAYPTADWTYGEDKFKRLNYLKSKEDVKNKIIVLGKTTQSRIPTVEDVNVLLNFRKSWSESPVSSDIEGLDTRGDFKIYTHCWWGDPTRFSNYYVYVGWANNDYEITGYSFSGDNINLLSQGLGSFSFQGVGYNLRCGFLRFTNNDETALREGNYSLQLMGRKRNTYETRYDQISVFITDPNSIVKYGEKDGGSVVYPLLETVEQCEAVGRKYIQEKHRNIVNANFRVPFNPLIIAGQTVQFSDSKIGLTTERYIIEGLRHTINPSGDCNTEVRCVYYV